MRVRLLAFGLVLLLFPRLSPAEPAHRVVSMNPSLTAILVAIGAVAYVLTRGLLFKAKRDLKRL